MPSVVSTCMHRVMVILRFKPIDQFSFAMSEVRASELGSCIGPADHLLSWQCLSSGIFFRLQEHVMSSGSQTMLEADCNIKLRLFLRLMPGCHRLLRSVCIEWWSWSESSLMIRLSSWLSLTFVHHNLIRGWSLPILATPFLWTYFYSFKNMLWPQVGDYAWTQFQWQG